MLDDLIRRKIKRLRALWKSCSRKRDRDAQLPYIEAVLALHRLLRKRGEAKKAGKRIAELYGFALRDDMHTVRCIIEASSETTPKKMSRLTQAIRYMLEQGWRTNLAEKIAGKGGIKGCANRFGKSNKGARYSRRKPKTAPSASELSGATPSPLGRGGAASGAQSSLRPE